MTITVDQQSVELPPQIEKQLREIASRQGLNVAEFVGKIMQALAISFQEQVTLTDRVKVKPTRGEDAAVPPPSPAELIAELEAEGLLTGYGDPSIDSPELARQLSERFSRREASE